VSRFCQQPVCPGCPIFIVDGIGKLTGARNVDVGGVALRMLISEMGHASHCSPGDNVVVDFAFQTEPAAEAAAAALLVQVFVDGSHIHISERYPHLAVKGCAGGQA
jgi:hypothetical protein